MSPGGPGGVKAVLALCAALASAGSAGEEAAQRRTELGPVAAVVRLAPDVALIGDTLVLTLEVTAQAGVELLMPEFGTALERFTILEFVPREGIDEQGRTVSSQRYRLQPLASGEHAIPPITIEFVDRRPGQRPAPEDEDAYELLTERIPFRIDSVVPAGSGGELKPALGPLPPAADGGTSAWPWLLAAAGTVLLVAVALLARKRLGGRAGRRPPHAVALARLDALEARPRPDAEAMDGFFVELTGLVRHYLEERFALHAPELTTEEFLEVAARSPDLTREHRAFLQDFLRGADRVKFARHVPRAEEVERLLVAVREFLTQTATSESAAAGAPPPTPREAAHA